MCANELHREFLLIIIIDLRIGGQFVVCTSSMTYSVSIRGGTVFGQNESLYFRLVSLYGHSIKSVYGLYTILGPYDK